MDHKTRPFNLFLAMSIGISLTVALFSNLGHVPIAYAVAITVNTTADEFNSDGDCSLREAIAAANFDTAVDACAPGANADTIQFSLPTPAFITLTLGHLFIDNEPLTINGPGSNLLSISGNNTSRIFNIDNNLAVTITNMTIRDGFNHADGGGINSKSPLTLIGTTFINNHTNDDGGAVNTTFNITIRDSEFFSNTAAGQGGSINSLGAVSSMSGGRIENSQAGSFGGGFFANGSLTISGTQFINNRAQSFAGAAWVWQSATITNGYFERNSVTTSDIGAVYVKNNLNMSASSFISNTAKNKAGALLVGGSVWIRDGIFSGNEAKNGRAGALEASGNLWITNTHFIANQSASNGGAVVHTGSSGRIVNALFGANEASSNGGALYLTSSGNMEIVHATIAGPANPIPSAIHVAAGGSVDVENSIVASYTLGIVATSGTVHQDNNLFYQTTPTNGVITGGSTSYSGDPAFVNSAGNDYHLTIQSAALNTATNTGVAADGEGDARPGGSGIDIGYDETTFVSDVGISKSAITTPAANAPITYTITFTNVGTAFLPRLTITDRLPVEVAMPASISSNVVISDVSVGLPYVWQVNNVPPGSSGTITVSTVLTAVVPRGLFTNTVSIGSFATETNLSNNTAQAGVTVPNVGPIAVSDTVTIDEDVVTILLPLTNDIDGDMLSIDSMTTPGKGTAVISGSQQIVYTPTLNISGIDSFTYTTSDGELTDSTTITITINPVNDAPVIAEGDMETVTMSEDNDPTPFSLTLNGSDVENSPLTWNIVTFPAHGSATAAAGPALTSMLMYTPTTHYFGTDLFTIQLSDGQLTDTIAISITIQPVNDEPTAVNDTAVALRQRSNGDIIILTSGAPNSFNVLSNDVDVEGGLSVTAVGSPDQGGWVHINTSGVLLSYVPVSPLFTGLETFTYTTTDSALMDTAVVSMTAVDGDAGGANGSTFTVTNTGLNDTFNLQVEIPADIENSSNLALIFDELTEINNSTPTGYIPANMLFSLSGYLNGQAVGDEHIFAGLITVTLTYPTDEIAGTGLREASLVLFSWTDNGWTTNGLTIIKRDTTNHQLTLTLTRPGKFALFQVGAVYLPMIAKNVVYAPDLIVESATVKNNGQRIEVVITNIGNSAVVNEFWVDMYINTSTVPTGVNQTWQMLGNQGVVWGVTANALPINPGQSATLTLTNPYYDAALSKISWPIAKNTPIYVQVDSNNTNSTYGGVREVHEITNGSYNNITFFAANP
jgi:CSLREA domain-containing protein/uncharacterized repeat protein (TIGR01451 family)